MVCHISEGPKTMRILNYRSNPDLIAHREISYLYLPLKEKVMKKFLMLILLIALVPFQACSSDDDSSHVNGDPIIGTWELRSIDPSLITVEGCETASTLSISDNNTSSASFYSPDNDCVPLTVNGSWEYHGSNMYSIPLPTPLGTRIGEVEFEGTDEFYFITNESITMRFVRQ